MSTPETRLAMTMVRRIRCAEIARASVWDVGAQIATEEFWDAAVAARMRIDGQCIFIAHPDGDWIIEIRVPTQSLVPGLIVYTLTGVDESEERWLLRDDTIVLPYGRTI